MLIFVSKLKKLNKSIKIPKNVNILKYTCNSKNFIVYDKYKY